MGKRQTTQRKTTFPDLKLHHSKKNVNFEELQPFNDVILTLLFHHILSPGKLFIISENSTSLPTLITREAPQAIIMVSRNR